VATKVKPLGDRVLVEPQEKEETTASGLVLPDTAKERPQEGKVIAVGPGRLNDDGKRIAMDIKAGDVVVYSKFAGTEYSENGTDYLVLRESDILAKVSAK
jgi:chaperonin GroES|tara:strand:+ start:90 stop:389 length:300 start_codon:yes stop_codon:yes gene_type:complete